MKPLALTPDLETVARRCVWFKTPAQALGDPVGFVAQVLTFGLPCDVQTLRAYVSDDDLRDALEQVPPGVMDGRSWAYWRLMLDLPERPLPRRTFDQPS